MTTYNVSLLVDTDDPQRFSQATEVMARALAGLGLEGIEGSLMVDQNPKPEPDE